MAGSGLRRPVSATCLALPTRTSPGRHRPSVPQGVFIRPRPCGLAPQNFSHIGTASAAGGVFRSVVTPHPPACRASGSIGGLVGRPVSSPLPLATLARFRGRAARPFPPCRTGRVLSYKTNERTRWPRNLADVLPAAQRPPPRHWLSRLILSDTRHALRKLRQGVSGNRKRRDGIPSVYKGLPLRSDASTPTAPRAAAGHHPNRCFAGDDRR